MISRQTVLRWHRRLGLAALLFVLVLAVTGVLLNHTDRLGFDRARVSGAWLLDWYGLDMPEELAGFRLEGKWAVWADGQLYFQDAPSIAITRPVGAVRAGDTVFIAGGGQALLLTRTGALVERIGEAALPGPVDRVGRAASGAVVIEVAGRHYVADGDFVSWHEERGHEERGHEERRHEGDAGAVRWSRAEAPPPEIEAAFAELYRGDGLPVARVLLDVHSGHFWGAAGPYVMDGAAVLLILVSLSGFYNWWRRRD